MDEEKENSASKSGYAGSDFKSRVMSFFSYGNNVAPKQLSMDSATPQANEVDTEPTWKSNKNKDGKLFTIDSETRLEWVKMLQYYKSSYSSKTTSKMDKYLPTFIEMDSPIPEELSMDYEIAKYDISGLVPLPPKITPEYSETLIKYETLKWFCEKKADVYRKMNQKLVEKVEINLFPLILENAILLASKNPEAKEFMISINGTKRKKFWHHSLTDYFEIYKENLLIGWLRGKKYEFVFTEHLNDPRE